MFSTHDGDNTYIVSWAAFAFLYDAQHRSLITWDDIHAKWCLGHTLRFSVKSNQCATAAGAGGEGLCTLRNQDTAGCTSGLWLVWNNLWNALKHIVWRTANFSFFQASIPETYTCLTTKIIWQLCYIPNQFISTCEDSTDMRGWLGRSGKKHKNK